MVSLIETGHLCKAADYTSSHKGSCFQLDGNPQLVQHSGLVKEPRLMRFSIKAS